MAASENSAEIFELDSARARLRVNEIDPKNFLTVGAFLEAVRESAGVSVAELSQKTHIKPQYIEAIEAADASAMPAKPFAIGFVRAIAEMLGLEPEAVVERFKAEAGYATPQHEADTPVEESSERVATAAEPSLEQKEMSLIAVVVIIAFMCWCAFAITKPRDVSTPVRLDGSVTETGGAVSAMPVAGLGQSSSTTQITPPSVSQAIDPVFPLRCEAGAQSTETVDVVFTVTSGGRVSNERVSAASNACFERAALNAIRQWRFQPQTIDGVARPAYEQAHRFTFLKP